MKPYPEHPLDHVPLIKEPFTPLTIKSPAEIFPFCEDITSLVQEGFFVILLNVKRKVLQRRLITFGLQDTCLVHPREVYRYAIKEAASCIICIHNHPSGDLTPSAEDIRITRQLIEAGRIIDVSVVDHIIIGNSEGKAQFFSMRESGVVSF